MKDIRQEITPVKSDELFVVLDHPEANFDYPLHCHSEYEINLVLHSRGTHTISTRKEDFGEADLVIISPFVPHAWKGQVQGNRVVTIQFSGKMREFPIMRLKQFRAIDEFLERAMPAAKFGVGPQDPLVLEALSLTQARGFDATTAFLHLLNSMAEREYSVMGDFAHGMRPSGSRRVAKVCEYSQEHLGETIRLSDVSSLVGMSDSAFSHFFKLHTSLSYISYLNQLRIAKACRMLESGVMSISEICWDCGFNNKSNFNRIFLKAKGMTPTAYRRYISTILV